MYPVSADFHALAVSDNPQTRIRIYFISDTIDCTDDNDVQTNGTLLVGAAGETDSNARIEQGGVMIDGYFNHDLNVCIGETVSAQIGMTLINSDGALNNFTFGRCKVYIDVYDPDNEAWLPCPMGVYNIDIPKRRRVQLVTATGFDQMQRLDIIADAWWNGMDWAAGITTAQNVQRLCSTVGVALSPNAVSNMANASVSFTAAPFTAVEMTYRDILSYLAEFTGTIARFDRNGALDLKWYAEAQIDGGTAQIDTDTIGNPCLSIEVAEYTFPQISQLNVKATDTVVGVSIGSGSNVYSILNNPLLFGADEAEITEKATPIYNRLNTLPAFNPITIRVIADWSIEAGDIVNVLNGGQTYALPIFQQGITWRGGYVFADIISSGDTELPTTSAAIRKDFRAQTQLHEFEVTIDQLRSLIQDINGNYSLIQQTVDSIQQVIATQNVTIQNILDPTGEIWTAIQTNSTNLGNIENALNAEITERKSYIRFIPAEPAIVLGVDTGNEIKLKLVNNRIWFFNGDDDSTDLSQAFAYFNSEEAFADRFVAKNSVQIGTSDDANHWLWKKLDNGDLVLDLV